MLVSGRAALVLGLLSPSLAAWAQDGVSAKASVKGVVRDASTGSKRVQATTNFQAQFTLEGLDPEQVSIYVSHFFLGGNATEVVHLREGQNPELVEIRLRTGGHISGRVLDQNGKPLTGVTVQGLYRVWSMGKLEYAGAGSDVTRSDGQYYIDGLPAGRGYLIQARLDRSGDAKAISDVPEDPKLRTEIWAPTYYPSADSPERAVVIPLESNDEREHIDISLLRSPSYCVSGAANLGDGPNNVLFMLSDRTLSLGFETTMSKLVPMPDGKFRICDLYPGEYSLSLAARNRSTLGLVAAGVSDEARVAIVDRDIDKVATTPVVRSLTISGQIVWDGTPQPLDPEAAFLGLKVVVREDGHLPSDAFATTTRLVIPGGFSVDAPVFGNMFSIQVSDVPAGAYVKEMSYNGMSIVNDMKIPKAPGNLLITLGTDGARIAAKVTDKDGNPVPAANIAMIPGNPDSEAALAVSLRSGKTDPQGNWTSEFLRPGKYAVLATHAPIDQSYEAIEKLWLERGEAQAVDLMPGATAPVVIVPTSLR